MSSLPSHRRVVAMLGALAVVAIVLVGSALAATEAQRQDIQQRTERYQQLRMSHEALGDAVHDQEAAVDDVLIAQTIDLEAAYREAAAIEADTLALMRALATDVPDLNARLIDLESAMADWRETFAEPVIAAVRAGMETGSFADTSSDRHEFLDELVEGISAALESADAELAERSAELAGDRSLAIGFGLVVAILAAGLSMFVIARYGRAIERDARHIDKRTAHKRWRSRSRAQRGWP